MIFKTANNVDSFFILNGPKYKICKFFYLDLDSPYFIEDIGQTSCQNGTKIMNAEKCKTACIELERNIGKMKSGRECYIAGNGKCRQAGRIGKKSSLVCRTRGNPDILQCSSAMSHNNMVRLDLHVIWTFSSV